MADTSPSSNYFTFILYPNEFYEIHDDTILWELGTIYRSPLHNANALNVPMPLEFMAKTEYGFIQFRANCDGQKKAHYHYLVKTPNKMTSKKFGQLLASVLQKDFTGLAYCESQCLVKCPEVMLRYFFHIDSPMKESFCLMDAFRCVPSNFTKEFVKAFDVEIRAIITGAIQNGEIENIQQILFYNDSSLVFTEWLYRGRNMYVINSMFNEIRKVKVSK